MDTSYFKEFVTLAETGNFMEASDNLYMAQSSLSKHIKHLEVSLGVQLFERSTRKVRLSDHGERFLPYARQILSLQEQYKAHVEAEMKLLYTSLSIGSVPFMSPYHTMDVLSCFRKNNPNCQLNLLEGRPTEVLEMLQNKECQIAFLPESAIPEEKYHKISFAKDHLAAILPNTHPYAKRNSLCLEDLKNETFLFSGKKCSSTYQLFEDGCKQAGFIPNEKFMGYPPEQLLHLVEQGLGIIIIARTPAERFANAMVSIVDITPELHTNVCLVYPKNTPLTLAGKQFLESAKDFFS